MKKIKRLLFFVLIILIVICGYQVKLGYDKYQYALKIKPLNVAIEEFKAEENYTAYEDIPEIYFKALVAVEDRRFYKHNGFDIIGSARARKSY